MKNVIYGGKEITKATAITVTKIQKIIKCSLSSLPYELLLLFVPQQFVCIPVFLVIWPPLVTAFVNFFDNFLFHYCCWCFCFCNTVFFYFRIYFFYFLLYTSLGYKKSKAPVYNFIPIFNVLFCLFTGTWTYFYDLESQWNSLSNFGWLVEKGGVRALDRRRPHFYGN